MKKRVLFTLLLLLLIPITMLGQTANPVPADTTVISPITPPESWADVIMNPAKWFVDIGTVTVLIAFIAAFVNGLLKIVKGFPRQVIAWLIGIILVTGSDLLNFGYAAEYPILLAVINGFAAGLMSNGAYNVPWIKALLEWIEVKLNPKKVTG
jgi:hypothetical protein